MRLYPEYNQADRRQKTIPVKNDKRNGQDRRKEKRSLLSTRVGQYMSRFKLIAKHLFNH
jgi:hypothetical protein